MVKGTDQRKHCRELYFDNLAVLLRHTKAQLAQRHPVSACPPDGEVIPAPIEVNPKADTTAIASSMQTAYTTLVDVKTPSAVVSVWPSHKTSSTARSEAAASSPFQYRHTVSGVRSRKAVYQSIPASVEAIHDEFQRLRPCDPIKAAPQVVSTPQKDKVTRKPELLVTMEDMLNTHIPAIDPLDEEVYEKRWSIYRKCFAIFIEATPTYRAVLQRILDENDLLLETYHSALSSPNRLFDIIVEKTEEHKAAIAAVTQKCNMDVTALKTVVAHHEAHIEQLQTTLQSKVSTLTSLRKDLQHLKAIPIERDDTEASLSRMLTQKMCQNRAALAQIARLEQRVVDLTNEVEKRNTDQMQWSMDLERRIDGFKESDAHWQEMYDTTAKKLEEETNLVQALHLQVDSLKAAVGMERLKRVRHVTQAATLQAEVEALRTDMQTRTPRPDWAAYVPNEILEQWEVTLTPDMSSAAVIQQLCEMIERMFVKLSEVQKQPASPEPLGAPPSPTTPKARKRPWRWKSEVLANRPPKDLDL